MADTKLPTQTEYLKARAIKPNTPEMEQLLSSGYNGMTVATAKQIIEEREKNPQLWPFERYEQAKAFLAAYSAKPQVIDPDPGWKRERPRQE
jgi:hypothetical protein